MTVCGAPGSSPGTSARLETVFGTVSVERLAYRARGVGNLHPADTALNLPVSATRTGCAGCARWRSARQLRRRDRGDRAPDRRGSESARSRSSPRSPRSTSRTSTRTAVLLRIRTICWCSPPTAKGS